MKTDGEQLLGVPGGVLRSAAEELRSAEASWDFDEALAQIMWEECRVCPLCGVPLDGDGNVVDGEPPDPGSGPP
jgi:hypothetical protein